MRKLYKFLIVSVIAEENKELIVENIRMFSKREEYFYLTEEESNMKTSTVTLYRNTIGVGYKYCIRLGNQETKDLYLPEALDHINKALKSNKVVTDTVISLSRYDINIEDDEKVSAVTMTTEDFGIIAWNIRYTTLDRNIIIIVPSSTSIDIVDEMFHSYCTTVLTPMLLNRIQQIIDNNNLYFNFDLTQNVEEV